jgi:hypothetical protein
MQFSMLIQNMIVLLHNNLVLTMTIEVYRRNSWYLVQDSEKVAFLPNETT